MGRRRGRQSGGGRGLMIKWKVSKSRRKRKEKMKMRKMMVWMGEVGIYIRGVNLSIR